MEQKPDSKRRTGDRRYRQFFSGNLIAEVQKNGSGSGGVSGVKRSFCICMCVCVLRWK